MNISNGELARILQNAALNKGISEYYVHGKDETQRISISLFLTEAAERLAKLTDEEPHVEQSCDVHLSVTRGDKFLVDKPFDYVGRKFATGEILDIRTPPDKHGRVVFDVSGTNLVVTGDYETLSDAYMAKFISRLK